MKRESEADLLNVLKKFAPGTLIRTALDDLMRARMGALIVVDTESLLSIVEGGFRVNTKFSSQKLVELAKMDGAIILSEDMKKILYANTLLSPDVHIRTKETGTRHKAAERTARQMGAVVIAVSERKNKITLYYGGIRHELENSSEILRRATETLQIMEKQKEMLNELMINFNVLEISGMVTMSDVCNVLQRIEIMGRVADIVRRYLVELGREGIIVSMRLKELTRNIEKDKRMILKDYFKSKSGKIDYVLECMSFDILLETSNVSKELFGESHDKIIFPSGFRLLEKLNLNSEHIELLVNNFGNPELVFGASEERLRDVLKDDELAGSLKQDLESLKEKIVNGKEI